jgi:hypothetical protein
MNPVTRFLQNSVDGFVKVLEAAADISDVFVKFIVGIASVAVSIALVLLGLWGLVALVKFFWKNS